MRGTHYSKPFLISRKNIKHLKMPITSFSKDQQMNGTSIVTKIEKTKKPSQNEFEKEVLRKVDDEQLSSSTFAIVRITNVSTQEEQVLRLVDAETIGRALITNTKKIIGRWNEWQDEGDEFSEDIKDKDGIVLSPVTGEPLYEFVVLSDGRIPAKTYREYSYLVDHGTLQYSNEIEYIDDF